MHWYQRLFAPISRFVARIFSPNLAAAGSAGRIPAAPGYPVGNSMSAMSRFPWVWTAVRAVASDLAGLPLVAVPRGSGRAGRGGSPARFVSDPALDLLESPNPGCTGRLFRMQLAVDFLCTGNAYIWRTPGASGAIYRIHPRAISPIPGALGIPRAFELRFTDGTKRDLPPSEVIHLRDINWTDDMSAILGESAMRCLHDDLLRELGARKLAAEQANKGHPDVIFSVKGAAGPKKADEIATRWETSRRERHSAFAIFDDATVTQYSWSSQDMQLAEHSEMTRDAVLAVFEVPPARAGLAGANYGTQRQQMRTYWESLVRRCAAFNEAFSQLARPGIRIEHDFSDVESLQVSYTERLMRVSTWVQLGADPRDAAAYEGFVDAPLPEEQLEEPGNPRPIDRQPEEPQEDREQGSMGAVEIALGVYFEGASDRYADMLEAERSGADIGMLMTWETGLARASLRAVGVDIEPAEFWADEIAQSTMEAVRIANTVEGIQAFDHNRASRLAQRIAA